MRLTPTRRRRRGNGTVESWTNGEDDTTQQQPPEGAVEVPTVTLPAHVMQTPQVDLQIAAPTPAPSVGEMQSVETIQAATELLQLLEQLQVEMERTAQYGVGDNIHLAHDYRTVCADFIKQFPRFALSKDIDQRLWSSWQRELAALEGFLAAAATAPLTERDRLKAESERKLRDALYVALRNYSTLIQDVQANKSASVSTPDDTTKSLLIHRLALSQAHVMYALEIHANTQGKKSWRTPELYYERARRWCVAQGETHYHLARIVLHDGRCAEALYHLVRSRVAATPFASPGSLVDQFVHVSSLRDSNTSSDPAMSHWVNLDRAVLTAVAPYFGQHQEFMTQRRSPNELTSAMCEVLDSICGGHKVASSSQDENESTITAGSMRIVRIMCLLISCACLKMEFVQNGSTVTSESTDLTSVNNPRVMELIVSVVNGLLHRILSAITSPLHSVREREHALQLMLPAVTTSFNWLVKLQWRDMVAEATRASCEQLSTMVLTGVIAGGFLAPHEDHTSSVSQASPPLTEEVEVMGLTCYEGITNSAAGSAMVHDLSTEESMTERELLQRRIVKFLSFVESFMTPRPVAAAVIASTAPSASTADEAHDNIAHQLGQLSVADNSSKSSEAVTRRTESSSSNTASSNAKGLRELWTPDQVATSTSSSKSKDKGVPQSSKPSAGFSPPVTAPIASPSASVVERVVVLDAANIAMRHGLQRRFSCRGIQLCAEFFIAQGDRVVAFLPDYCLDVDADGSFRRRVAASGGGGRGRRREGRCTITPDDRVLLEILVDSGVVVLTPAMDSDDLYCIHYARRHNAFLVTNDLFRDHISETDGPKARQTELRNWLQTRRISYTWVADEFLPNPNSAYEKMRLTAAATAAP